MKSSPWLIEEVRIANVSGHSVVYNGEMFSVQF